MNISSKHFRSATKSESAEQAVAARLRREHLVFEADGLLYAVALADFDSVAEAGYKPQTVANLPAWRGYLDDERGVAPVLSLHDVLGATVEQQSAATAIDHRLLRFHRQDLACALFVDRCLGVFPIEYATHLPLARSPLLRTRHTGFRSVIKWDRRLIVTLSPAELITPELAARLREELAGLNKQKKSRKRDKTAAAPKVADGTPLTWEGTLDGCTLPQIMQVLWLKKLTGELALESNDRSAALFWAEGQLIHARTADSLELQTPAALNFRNGRFRFRGGPVTGIGRTIPSSTPNLIEETVRALAATTQKS